MKEKRAKKKKRGVLRAPLTFLIACAALVFGMSVFFRVSSVEVEGNTIYSDEEIIEASGIEVGDNLFFFNKFSAIAKLRSRLPYVEKAAINRSLPNKLVVEVSESASVACVQAEDGLWAIDRSCKLLSQVDAQTASSLIRVRGLTPVAPESGQIVSPGEAETPKVTYLSDILTQIQANDMLGDVSFIDMEDVSNPSFGYLDRFTVKLGAHEDIEYKFLKLLSAVRDGLAAGDRGTLDLSVDKQVHLTYE